MNVLLAPYNPLLALQGQIGLPTEKVTHAPFIINILIKHRYSNEHP